MEEKTKKVLDSFTETLGAMIAATSTLSRTPEALAECEKFGITVKDISALSEIHYKIASSFYKPKMEKL